VTEKEAGADERMLVEAARKDPARFGELYELHFDRVYAYVSRRVRDRAAAEDVTSEVFHKALKNIGTFEWRGVPFVAWLFRIASNALADRARRDARERTVAAPEAFVEMNLAEIDGRVRLFRFVDDLPGDQRRVILMRFAEERSIREIAQELGRSDGAVKQLQFRALENLRARMGGTNG
jgi:RNA polymerase sigma-70 factor (ECF subfamily)